MIDIDEIEGMLKAGDYYGHATSPSTVLGLTAEVRRLRESICLQAGAAHMGMDAAKRVSTIQLQLAERARAESSPEVLASERGANAMLTEENERRTAERDSAVEMANTNALDASRWRHIYDRGYIICRVMPDGTLRNLGGSYVGKHAIDELIAAHPKEPS